MCHGGKALNNTDRVDSICVERRQTCAIAIHFGGIIVVRSIGCTAPFVCATEAEVALLDE